MAADDTLNPNAFDEPQQVMRRRNATASQGGNADRRPSVMNGVQAPLRGSQDMDGEVVERPQQPPATAQAGQATEGVATAVTAAVSNQAHAGNVNPTPLLSAGAGALATSGILEGDSGTPVPAQDGPRPSSHPSGVLSGVLRAVQALPATVETLVNRPAGSRSGQGTPAQHDSVEYASVAASVRSSAERAPPPPPSVPEQGPLFDVPTLARMRQMQESAPLLYPEASLEYVASRSQQHYVGVRAPADREGPTSASSSELQAEVRRQLNELMAVRDEESRRLRAQVEALSVENHSLRVRAELEAQHGIQPSRSQQGIYGGFPSFGWLGRGLGSLMGQSRQERTLELGRTPSLPPPPPFLPNAPPTVPPPQPSPRAILNQELRAVPATGLMPELVAPGNPSFGLGLNPYPTEGVAFGTLDDPRTQTAEPNVSVPPIAPAPALPTTNPYIDPNVTVRQETGPSMPVDPATLGASTGPNECCSVRDGSVAECCAGNG